MDFRLQTSGADSASLATDAMLAVVTAAAPTAGLEPALAELVSDALSQGDLEAKAGRSLMLHRPAGWKARRLVVAVAADGSAKSVRNAVAAGMGLLKSSGAKQAAVRLAGIECGEAQAEAVVSAASDAVYLYRHTKPSAPAAPKLARLTLLVNDKAQAAAAQRGLVRGAAVAKGVELARELANRPANHCTPSFLAAQAKALGKQYGFKVQALDRAAVEKLGMGSFLAVAQGSAEPLRFIVVEYQGAGKGSGKGAAPVVLVGKGITFDTGGISLKPGAEMDEMKFDMGGAASVLGTLAAIGELRPRVNVVALIPATENMPGGRAVKPGDVVTSLSGQTIEILNTDAEGRLVLCDALTYAERYKPQAVVDIATLTGACVIALGHHHSGLFCADDALAAQLLEASRQALDPAWRMPLDEEYDEALKSNFADMANIGGRAGGAVTAAMFLRRYTGKYPWAHLDIAGTAWKSGAAKGATGRPVPLLTHFVLSRAS